MVYVVCSQFEIKPDDGICCVSPVWDRAGWWYMLCVPSLRLCRMMVYVACPQFEIVPDDDICCVSPVWDRAGWWYMLCVPSLRSCRMMTPWCSAAGSWQSVTASCSELSTKPGALTSLALHTYSSWNILDTYSSWNILDTYSSWNILDTYSSWNILDTYSSWNIAG